MSPRLKPLTKQQAAETATKAGEQKNKAGGRTKEEIPHAYPQKKPILDLLSAIYYSDRVALKHVCMRLF